MLTYVCAWRVRVCACADVSVWGCVCVVKGRLTKFGPVAGGPVPKRAGLVSEPLIDS